MTGPGTGEKERRVAPGTEVLAGKTVLLISPQPWDHIPVSKHHYALELASRGNRVFFLERPDPGRPCAPTVTRLPDHPGVAIVRYRPWIPSAVRYHAARVLGGLLRREVRGILRALPAPPDVVWCFDPNAFPDLAAFGAPLTIYHPVDRLERRHQVAVARSADLVLSVSPEILASVDGAGVPTRFVHHGLAPPFAALARAGLKTTPSPRAPGPLRVGYAGNLVRPAIDRTAIRAMVEAHPAVEFHFWGPRTPTPLERPRADPDAIAFPGELERHRNARFHGALPPSRLASALQRMDCLLLAYDRDRQYDRSNAHKILEYLSTGRVIVSSRIALYAGEPDLVRMPERDDGPLSALLPETLDALPRLNDPGLQDRRRRLALEHTYTRQLDRIDAIVSRLDGPETCREPRPLIPLGPLTPEHES